MTVLDALMKLLNSPGTIWSIIILFFSLISLGAYIGWSLKFISAHKDMVTEDVFEAHKAAGHENMVTEKAFQAHQREDEKMFNLVRGDVKALRDAFEDLKDAIIKSALISNAGDSAHRRRAGEA